MSIFIKQFLDRFGAHFRDELIRIIAHQFAITLVGQQVFFLRSGTSPSIDDDVGFEVKDLFEIAQRDVEQDGRYATAGL